jgi:hypothetical protein
MKAPMPPSRERKERDCKGCRNSNNKHDLEKSEATLVILLAVASRASKRNPAPSQATTRRSLAGHSVTAFLSETPSAVLTAPQAVEATTSMLLH